MGPTIEDPIRKGDVPANHDSIDTITGEWSRSNVVSEYQEDYNKGIYPKECRIDDPELEARLLELYKKHKDPRIVMSFLNGEYTDDGRDDTWITSFKHGRGDCDSKALAAVDLTYTYLRPKGGSWGWIPMIALGDAWLEGPDGKGGSTRVPTPHAFNVFVRSDIKASVNANTYVKIGEPTYQRKNFADDGPGSGHIIKVSWLIYPNPGPTDLNGKSVKGSAIPVDVAHNMGQKISMGHENMVLLRAIRDAVVKRRDIVLDRTSKYTPAHRVQIKKIKSNGHNMPVMMESIAVV